MRRGHRVKVEAVGGLEMVRDGTMNLSALGWHELGIVQCRSVGGNMLQAFILDLRNTPAS